MQPIYETKSLHRRGFRYSVYIYTDHAKQIFVVWPTNGRSILQLWSKPLSPLPEGECLSFAVKAYEPGEGEIAIQVIRPFVGKTKNICLERDQF